VRQGCGGPRWSSSGRESRAPWRDGASWAGRSASSKLCAILSVRTRGSTILDPWRHANAPGARERIGAFVVRRMIGPAAPGCQTSDARLSSCRRCTVKICDTPQGYCEIRLPRLQGGAILCGPSAPGTLVGRPLGAFGGSSGKPHRRFIPAILDVGAHQCPCPDSAMAGRLIKSSTRTAGIDLNGCEAGLARRPR
jgi:hypothetical protein